MLEDGSNPTRAFLLALLLGAGCLGCHSPEGAPGTEGDAAPAGAQAGEAPWFEDVTEAAGLDFVHDPGRPGRYFLPQCVGSGAALFDFDGDGRLDVLLLQNGGPGSGATHRLFRQLPDGRFLDVSAGSGLDVDGHGMGVAVGDVDNDGRPDVFLTEYGRVRLFRNAGGGTFTDVTAAAGLENPLWGTSAAFFDYDRDGWLDLVVVNYVDYDPARWCADDAAKRDFCGPGAFRGTVTRLFHNLGPAPDGGSVRFRDVTPESGLGAVPGPGLGVFCADFTADGWPDIFVANDGQPNRLWVNQMDGTFKEEALVRGLAVNAMGKAEANMGVAVGDVDGDGGLDVFVTHLTDETNTLWKQAAPGTFGDQTVAAGLARPHWRGTGFGTVLADFDLDGAPDLAVVNGKVKRTNRAGSASEADADLDPFWAAYAERNQLFANDGRGRFRDVSPANPAFCGTGRVSRGLVCGDLDGDGAPDLLVTTVGGRARLYRNVAPGRGHWLTVRAVDPKLNRDAYGAEVRVRAGGRTWLRWVNPGSSYLCSNDPRAHFGLGPAGRVESIHVTWPDGSRETFPGRAADQSVVLRKGEGDRSEGP
jgi:hypothetical protein